MTDHRENQPPISQGEEDMSQFLWEIREYPRLTPEQERELAKRCTQGDQEAIRQMVSANLRLVVSIAREYAGRGVAVMDLIQEGCIGLLAAARKFDYTRDYRFSTYATKWIRQGVTRCLLNHASPIRVPVHTAEKMRKVQQTQVVLAQEQGSPPTPRQIAQKAGMPEGQVRKLQQLTPEVFSLDLPTGEAQEGSLQSLVEDAQSPQPYEALVRRELEQTMERLLSTLSPRQRQILNLHFGLEDGVCCSLEEIGRKLGISKERVRQVERQAMEKLQKNGANLGLEEFLNE